MSEAETPAAPAAAPDKPAAPAPAASAPALDKPAAPPAKPAAAPSEPAKPVWPEDWQRQMAGEDDKELKQIGRYASPKAVWEKARALERRMSSGELKPVKPKEAKPEELAAWRKDVGIPEKPEAYDLKFDSGLVIGKEDKPIIDNFLKSAHAADMEPTHVKAAVQWYFDEVARQVDERAAKDDKDRVHTLDKLNAEYGGQFRRNINLLEGVLSRFPDAVREDVKSARLPDGTALFNNPDVIRAFVAIALENNPAGIVAPAGIGDAPKVAMDEYRELQKYMKENRGAYNKDEGKQARMRELIGYLQGQGAIDQNGNEVRQQQKRKAA